MSSRDIINPLPHDGLARPDRFLPELDPAHAKIDDRSIVDLLAFAYRFSRHLRYFESIREGEGERVRESGNWQELLAGEQLFFLAVMAGASPERFSRQFEEAAGPLTMGADEATWREALWQAYLAVSAVFLEAARFADTLPKASRGYRDTMVYVERMTDQAGQLLKLFEASFPGDARLADYLAEKLPEWDVSMPEGSGGSAGSTEDGGDAGGTEGSEGTGGSGNSEGAGGSGSGEGAGGTGGGEGTGDTGGGEEAEDTGDDGGAEDTGGAGETGDDQRHRELQSLRKLFEEIRNVHSSIVLNARRLIEAELESSGHQAHVGLFLAFLHLFARNLDRLNGFTGRHLDFFLTEILKLSPSGRVPDQVHLLFEPAKGVRRHELAGGTALKGGKDADGTERIYELSENTVITPARVAHLKNLFAPRNEDADPPILVGVHAGAVANSKDGLGEALDEADPKWPGFGSAAYPFATLGLAVSSPLLRLKEGIRTIILTFSVEDVAVLLDAFPDASAEGSPSEHQLPPLFSGEIYTEKGWVTTLPDIFLDTDERRLVFQFELGMGDPAVVDYSPEESGDEPALPTAWPLIRLILRQEAFPMALSSLGSIRITGLDIDVEVENVRSLVVQNDLSLLKPSKPFSPFGPLPRIGSKFYVGSHEIFAKPLTDLRIAWDWVDPPDDLGTWFKGYTDDKFQYTVDIHLRKAHGWTLLEGDAPLSVEADPAAARALESLSPEKVADLDAEIRRRGAEILKKSGDDLLGSLSTPLSRDERDAVRDLVSRRKRNVRLIRKKGAGMRSKRRKAAKPVSFGPSGMMPPSSIGGKGFTGPSARGVPGAAPPRPGRAPGGIGPEPKGISKVAGSRRPDIRFGAGVPPLSGPPGTGARPSPKGAPKSPKSPVPAKGRPAGAAEPPSPPDLSAQFIDAFPLAVTDYPPDYDEGDFAEFSETLGRGGIRFTLRQPDFVFGHKAYGKLHSNAVAASIKDEDTTLLDELQLPHTPMLENLRLDYSASQSFDLSAEPPLLRLFRLLPFGFTGLRDLMLLPAFDCEGYLYIGIEELAPPQNLSLLVQFAEGSADPFIARPENVRWSCLTAAGWTDLTEREILRDSTLGFLQSGIVSLALPGEMADTGGEMPAGIHWLRVRVSDHTAALNDLISIQAQAGKAVFKDGGGPAEHLSTALPPGSVGKLLVRDKAVKSVSQPFASFGGRQSEDLPAFRMRSSERLRHKRRAVTLWDYEHLVLDRFPEVHKVKCLNHTSPASGLDPGHVTLVLIPDLSGRFNRYPLRPAVAQSVLERVEKAMAELCSEQVTVHAVNPFYESIQVEGRAHLLPGYDLGLYEERLHADIRKGLTPWLSGKADIHFGGRIHASVILNLIEELPYVDYITDFSVNHFAGPGDVRKGVEEVVATSPRSILVSHATHTIEGVTP